MAVSRRLVRRYELLLWAAVLLIVAVAWRRASVGFLEKVTSCFAGSANRHAGAEAQRHPRQSAVTLRAAKEPKKVTDLMGMRSREVKAFLVSKGINVDDCFDAESLVERAIATEAQWGQGFTSGNPYAPPAPAPSTVNTPAPAEVEAAWKRVCEAWPGAEPLEYGPGDASVSLIMLHGFGDAKAKFLSDTFAPLLQQMPGLRLTLPQAPEESLQGQRFQSWFLPTNGQWMFDDELSKPISAYIHAMVRREIARGVAPANILIGGFAQGGSCAVRAALSFPDAPLGGSILLSHFFGTAAATITPANKGLKILICHGRTDEVVQFSEGERGAAILRDILKGTGTIDFREYDMKHGLATDEVMDVLKFIDTCRTTAPASTPASAPASAPAAAASGGLEFDPLAAEAPPGPRRPSKGDRIPLRTDAFD
eukprot:TRINITY_DN123533_c0_g1_i1.p1 TRINITY_DN123533_c0_g1~~TRINITY_DN123533_c0_g1_i1.p1  ORF type:complete len:424 (-),score=88.17 TRINITY_DN123533_c0_g1_i1:12-1283(-)